jgi:hypothetical protein
MTNKTPTNSPNAPVFVGNRSVRCLDLVGPDKKTIRQKYLIGEPHSCPMGTAEEMKRRGFVGIYLREPAVLFRLPDSGKIVQKTW